MGNTPCAHAVDSVLHRRVEIKNQIGHCTTHLSLNFMHVELKAPLPASNWGTNG